MSTSLFSLAGRTALITGSSRGLGLAIAKGLAEAGARIILNGSDAERLVTAANSLREEGFEVLEAAFDVTDEAAITSAFERFDADGVVVDILVNNAGIQLRKPMLELSTQEWQRIMDVNLTSAFVVGREAGRRMVQRGSGKIINMGSMTSELARATVAPYTVSKSGIKMLTQAMAAEWAEHGIQANAIGPGYMLTDMNAPLINNPEFNEWVKARTPARRWGTPEELVGTTVYLASNASSFVNGQIIYLDGGVSAVL